MKNQSFSAFQFLWAVEFYAHLSWAQKKLYNPGARLSHHKANRTGQVQPNILSIFEHLNTFLSILTFVLWTPATYVLVQK